MPPNSICLIDLDVLMCNFYSGNASVYGWLNTYTIDLIMICEDSGKKQRNTDETSHTLQTWRGNYSHICRDKITTLKKIWKFIIFLILSEVWEVSISG